MIDVIVYNHGDLTVHWGEIMMISFFLWAEIMEFIKV